MGEARRRKLTGDTALKGKAWRTLRPSQLTRLWLPTGKWGVLEPYRIQVIPRGR